MKLFIIIIYILFLLSTSALAQGLTEFNNYDDAMSYLSKQHPAEEQFVFNKPSDWSSVSLPNAKVISVSEGEDIIEAQKIFDNKTNTSWKTKNYYNKPEVIIDLGSKVNFNTIVIYNRQSNNRGSAGGNDAVKTIEISYKNDVDSDFVSIGIFELNGPKAVCVKIKGAGQVCTFIDDPNPNIIDIPEIDAKYIKLKFIKAFWGEKTPDEWRDSFSLTEVMLYSK